MGLNKRGEKEMEKQDRLDIAQGLWFAGLDKKSISDLCEVSVRDLNAKIKKAPNRLVRFTKVDFDLSNVNIRNTLKSSIFLDIETTPVTVSTFGVGRFNKAGYSGLMENNQITINSVSHVSMYDFLTKGLSSLKNYRASFKKRSGEVYLCDSNLTGKLSKKLKQGTNIVAHNAPFDSGWLRGRMAVNGHKYEEFGRIDTLGLFRGQRHISKKLDYLCDVFLGVRKLPTSIELWKSVMRGDRAALDYMCRYNDVDVALMIPLYLIACRFNPVSAIRLNEFDTVLPRCSVSGQPLTHVGETRNPTTGLNYAVYRNDDLGLTYQNRYNTESKKAEKMLIKHTGSTTISSFTL